MKLKAMLLLLLCALAEWGFGQCSGTQITVDKAQQCAPGIVQFTINNQPSGSTVQWDFGNGYGTSADTAFEFFLNATTVDVKALIKLKSGGQCVIDSSGIAKLLPKPKPSFTTSRKVLCQGPDTVTFVNTTPNTKTLSWIIDGTNYPSSNSPLIHEYKTTGVKDISMIVTNNHGCKAIEVFEDVAVVYADVELDFVADVRKGCVTKEVSITSKINAKGENIISYLWNFEGADKRIQTTKDPSKLRFLKSGNFDASISVVTDKGCRHSLVRDDYFTFGDSVDIGLQFSKKLACLNDSIELKSSISDSGTFTWTFTGDPGITETSDRERHVLYSKPGTYGVTVEYFNNGCYTKSSYDSSISVKQVIADFSSSDYYHCYKPHTTHITNLSSTSHGQTVSYTWNYYDVDSQLVATSNNVNDSMSLSQWGEYDVELIAKDIYGCTDTFRRNGFIRVKPIEPNFTSDEFVGCVDQLITVDHKTDKSSYISHDSFYWELHNAKDSMVAYGSGPYIQHTFQKPGFYHVKMIAANTIGCRDSIKKKNYIEIIESNPEFSVSDTVLCAAQDNLFLKAESKPSRAPFSYAWNVLNDKDSLIKSVTFDTARTQKVLLYTPGLYHVQYIHKINKGCFDTLTKRNRVQVYGVRGKIKLDRIYGCDGTTVNPTFDVLYNVHDTTLSDTLTYSWNTIPNLGTNLLKNSRTPNPSAVFNESGQYQVYMRTTNSSGCRLSIYSDTINVGVVADFDADKETVCINDTVQIKNNSTYYATSHDWYIKPGGNYEFLEDSLQFIPSNDTSYTITLVSGYKGECYDTLTKVLRAIKVVSDFEVEKADLFCAPAYAQFRSTSSHGDSLIWDFGNGKQLVTSDTNVANIYQSNSMPGSGFDVSLIAKNNLGCSDTIHKPNVIHVIGPTPRFKLSNLEGCEPLEVKIEHFHVGATSVMMNFRDGSELDSTNKSSHLFMVQNGQDVQKFVPSAFAVDSMGCSSIHESEDTITVRKSPKIPTLDTALSNCFPGKVSSNFVSNDVSSYSWIFNGVEVGKKPAIEISDIDTGRHELQLVVKNHMECSDTNSRPFVVHALPVLDIHDSSYCLNVADSLFASSSNHENENLDWTWLIDNTNTTITGQGNIIPYTFTNAERYLVVVEAVDQNKCMGRSIRRFEIDSPDSIPQGKLDRLTFNDANDLTVEWSTTSSPYAQQAQLIDGFGNLVSESAIGALNSFTIPYSGFIPTICYQLQYKDKCDYMGMPSKEHCPVILRTSAENPFSITLQWNAYIGWDSYDYQVIYRKKGNGAYEELARVDNTTYNYVDSLLCDDSYTYYIEVVNGNTSTQSNRSHNTPQVFTNELPIHISFVTVKGNDVEINWNRGSNKYIDRYILTKLDSSGNRMIENIILDADQTSYLDSDVKVNSEVYRYSIVSSDHCSVKSLAGYEGRNILLGGEYTNNQATLTWSDYEKWADGVKTYEVQLRTPSGYKTIAEVDGSTTRYIDNQIHGEVKGKYCYRIIANSFEDGIQSQSNRICISGESFMWIPNAFSPNEDDLNPEFKPTASFINLVQDNTYQTYDMKVYNRWGELMFSTNDIHVGWDGSYNGYEVNTGMYVYHIRAKGIDNVIYNLKGTVRLMR